ncbi:MAG TPA: hypothetical protein VGL11_15465 [Candidatus Binatia bacterium]
MLRGLRFLAAVGLVSVITLGFGLRLYRPAADPPYWPYVYNTDEGHYSYNTRDKIKYGRWFVDEAKYALITPVFNLVQYAVAVALPEQTGIVRYRAVSILAGILFCVALGFLFEPGWSAWTAVALGSISFMGVVHSRMGIPEMTLTLLLLVTALLAVESEKRRSLVLYVITGIAAVACAATKLTGVLIFPVLLTIPALCGAMRGHRLRYFWGVGAGVLLGGLALSLIVIPHYADWLKMLSQATSFARDSVEREPLGWLRALSRFLLSPAMQMMPILWPATLCWSILVFLPRLKKGENDFAETLLFLWLSAGTVMFGLSSYQPARWQLLIFPPVIALGLKFLFQTTPRAMTAALVLAVTLSATFSLVYGGGLLKMETDLQPGFGLFSDVVTAALAGAAFVAGLAAAKIANLGWKTGVVCGALLLEIGLQTMLQGVYMKPSYARESQWATCSRGVESLRRGENDLFAGSVVQDLSLRADIRALPTFYVIDESRLNDGYVRDFFRRHNASPDYFLLLDAERPLWIEKAPLFVSSLQPVAACRLLLGGFREPRELYVYRIRSHDWLK